MAGIYIHIPFCRQKCYYCDFYKTVNTSLQHDFISALKNEAKVRKNYLNDETVETIYFGGGTPSVLTAPEIAEILAVLNDEFKVNSDAEITFEANPDDLSNDYLKALKREGINRLSIGIQAFQNRHLEKMNRRHNVAQAVEAIENAAKNGFTNLSADLIYGLPDLTPKEWEESLNQMFRLPVKHLSAYHLTYHEGTAFYTWLKKGTLKELKEAESVAQFNTLVDLSIANGFEHYEISNLAKDQLYSRHNTAYWMGTKYLGLGPSAHSFDGVSRRWNDSSVEAYIKAQANNQTYFEEEKLSENDQYNEYILTRIRTKWGVSERELEKRFGSEKANYFSRQLARYNNTGVLQINNETITLTRKGLFVSDEIMADLMII
ncbi:oxygen-independent coproporphyrinogen-3 oxidase [Draconibacterium orientale]|uniref:Heme chaperone HemW n=1 Tax=Draconibacterium orientale TaxID=1168034 RepID=X5DZ03_9BACT|nr:radical SAM family heme chaperone HemW [Draconibacterium orientale]AHW59541.1 coproporphyrinogen III oxidase [Draconibacterium orientale]SES91718.1 oxygen-independent coproporphyrinogen-3 oxidase [Draconibacterium orientale]